MDCPRVSFAGGRDELRRRCISERFGVVEEVVGEAERGLRRGRCWVGVAWRRQLARRRHGVLERQRRSNRDADEAPGDDDLAVAVADHAFLRAVDGCFVHAHPESGMGGYLHRDVSGVADLVVRADRFGEARIGVTVLRHDDQVGLSARRQQLHEWCRLNERLGRD